jgi:hypothetical protein
LNRLVRNKKGERVMQKVKVERYRAGIKPDFASASDVVEFFFNTSHKAFN